MIAITFNLSHFAFWNKPLADYLVLSVVQAVYLSNRK